MRLATLRRAGLDGALAVVTAAGDRAVIQPGGYATFQAALDDWPRAAPMLNSAYERLLADDQCGELVDWDDFHSPLPRAYQWCESSSYLTHMERLRKARGADLPPDHTREPIVYQSGSSRMLPPRAPIPLPDASWNLDLEATLAVITDDVPIGTTPDEVPAHVLFVVLLNDLTYRSISAREMQSSVGPYQAKPARPFAPIAVSPDALGELWNGRVLRSTVRCSVNDAPLGTLESDVDCTFDFADTIAHMTRTRELAAGSIVGLGTVSNRNPANGYGSIGEKRAVETVENGQPSTPWLTHGDTVRVEAFGPDGASLFGAIEQRVIPSSARGCG